MICSGTVGPGELSSDGTFPVPPQSGHGIVLGSSSIIEIIFGAGIAERALRLGPLVFAATHDGFNRWEPTTLRQGGCSLATDPTIGFQQRE